MISDVCATSTS